MTQADDDKNDYAKVGEIMFYFHYIDWLNGPRHKQIMEESAELCEKIRKYGFMLYRPFL